MSAVVLLAAVHDPEARFPRLLPADLPPLRTHYPTIHAICGAHTARATVDALRTWGIGVTTGDDLPVNTRPHALRLIAAHPEWAHVHLCDFDSALHWARAWPDELAAVNARIATHDFLLLGRTARATATLPDSQRATEGLINLMFTRTTRGFAGWRQAGDDVPMDICTGAWGLSPRAAAALAARATITDIGFHAEWPLLARDMPGLRCGYLPCEGLEYETADRYADEIAAAGGLDAWHARQETDITRWQGRLAYITQVADTLRSLVV